MLGTERWDAVRFVVAIVRLVQADHVGMGVSSAGIHMWETFLQRP